MSKHVRALICVAAIPAVVYGCAANMMETRTIENFAAQLEKKNFEGLRQSTSSHFEELALHTAQDLDDFKILNLPTGKTSVVKVEEFSPTRKRVTVEVGEQKREIFYEIVQNTKGQWVVDDIFLKQRKKGVTAYKSVTEQMNLLLSVREFISAWTDGSREKIIDLSTPEMGLALADLPPSSLSRLTKLVAGDTRSSRKTKPQASMEDTTAIVRLPRSTGETVLTLRKEGDDWRVQDIAIDSKEESEQIASVYKQSLAVGQCLKFLAAYHAKDLEQLKELCRPDFYEGAISIGDLAEAPLPTPMLPEHELKIDMHGSRLDCTLSNDKEVIHIAMHRDEGDTELLDSIPTFRVSEVSLFDMQTQQERHLTALFTADAMLDLFVKSLAARDLASLKHLSTRDFTARIWSQVDDQTLPGLPLDLFDDENPQVIAHSYQGALTTIRVKQSGEEVVYDLREQEGQFRVDDIEVRLPHRPTSLKTTLEACIPVQRFAVAISLGRDPKYQEPALDALKRNSSTEFTRVVWKQTKFVPNSGMSADTFLNAPLSKMTVGEGQAVLTFGSAVYGAEVRLVKENEQFVVDDVILVAGAEESQRLALKHTFRVQLAEGTARAPQAVAREEKVPARKLSNGALQDSHVRPAAAIEGAAGVEFGEFPEPELHEPAKTTPSAASPAKPISGKASAVPEPIDLPDLDGAITPATFDEVAP